MRFITRGNMFWSIIKWLKREPIVTVKYIGTDIQCNMKDCIELENGKCSISLIELNGVKQENGQPTFSCSEYCQHDVDLIDDTNRIIMGRQ